MKVKVCGLRNFENVLDIGMLPIDFMGFIFYKKSKRYVGDFFKIDVFKKLNPNIKKVAVFVNESLQDILEKTKGFDFVQLHGNETVEYCQSLKEKNIKIIKAFGVSENFNFKRLENYLPFCDYFLFDTKSQKYGGTGKKYNWEILANYNFDMPFFLSGGISVKDVENIKNLNFKNLVAVDLNSKFEEDLPAIKDFYLIRKFIKKLK